MVKVELNAATVEVFAGLVRGGPLDARLAEAIAAGKDVQRGNGTTREVELPEDVAVYLEQMARQNGSQMIAVGVTSDWKENGRKLVADADKLLNAMGKSNVKAMP